MQRNTTLAMLGALALAAAWIALIAREDQAPAGAARPGTARPAGAAPAHAPTDRPRPRSTGDRVANPRPTPGGASGRRFDVFGPTVALGLLDDDAQWRIAERSRTVVKLTRSSARAAIEHVRTGRADVAITWLPLSAADRADGVSERVLGDFVAVLVTQQAPRAISRADMRRVLTGEIRTWSRLGGPDEPIELLRPPDGPRAERYARLLIPGDRLSFGASLGNDREILRRTRRRPYAIGIVPLASLGESDRALTIEGIQPSPMTYRVGHYPFGDTLRIVHKGTPSIALQWMLDYAFGNAGRRALGHELCLLGR